MSRLGVAVGTSAQLAYRENTAWDKAFLPFSFCPVKHLRCAGAWGRRGPEPADGQQPLRSAPRAPSRVWRGGVYWVGVPEAVSRTPRGSARGWPQFMGRPPQRALESAGRGTAGGTVRKQGDWAPKGQGQWPFGRAGGERSRGRAPPGPAGAASEPCVPGAWPGPRLREQRAWP